MTNEEAKAFLDNLKICIDEHPIVADWLVEIADRKTEPQTDGYMTAEQAEDYRKMLDKAEHKVYGNIKDEPQTEDLQDWKDRMWAEAVIESQENTHDIRTETHECVKDTHDKVETMSCQECKWWFTDSLKHGGYCQSLLYNQECRYEPLSE